MTPPAPLVIVGAGGHGREVLDLLESVGRSDDVEGFVDDVEPQGEAAARLERRGARVLGDVEWLVASDVAREIAVGIGTSAVRRRIDERLALATAARLAAPLVHASAILGSDLRFADGVVIGAGTIVTTNVTIGRQSHVNAGCSVQHDSSIGDFVTISPGVFINGDVTIGDDVFVGTGAVICRGLTVGAGARIGAGAVVLDDVAPGSLVVGVPARPR